MREAFQVQAVIYDGEKRRFEVTFHYDGQPRILYVDPEVGGGASLKQSDPPDGHYPRIEIVYP